MAKKPDEQYTPEEIAQRADAALRRALNTPHKPHEPIGKVKPKPRDKGKKDSR